MSGPMRILFLGLSLSSSWGNGHATTYRALLRSLAERGHELVFLERDMPWYADNRDLSDPDFCRLELYGSVEELRERHAGRLAAADAVVIGSYVPDGPAVARLALAGTRGLVAFYDIDTPVTLAALRRGDCDYLDPELVPRFDAYFSFSGGRALDRLRQDHGARLALPLHCMVDETRYRPTGGPARWDLGYLGTYSPDRQPALERLLLEPARRLPGHRFVVAGPQYPADIDWPANVDRLDHVPPDAHPWFYGQLRFALNITRADMLETGHSPSVRLFEAAACATPVITDRWDGLGEFFPAGEAILVADTTAESIAALTSLDADARSRLAARARHLVLQGHTGRHRAAEFERGLALARLGRTMHDPSERTQDARAIA